MPLSLDHIDFVFTDDNDAAMKDLISDKLIKNVPEIAANDSAYDTNGNGEQAGNAEQKLTGA